MTDNKTLLSSGVEILRKNDEDTDCIISLRENNVISLLENYIKEIELFNPVYSLVGTNDTRQLVIKHILDSLSPLGIIYRLLNMSGEPKKQGGILKGQIADAGSGAGLPGIPLAIALPSVHFTLIERMNRRAGFLLNTTAALSLSNITVEENELEKTIGCFDIIIFRAFKPMNQILCKNLLKIRAPGGIIAAYKGKQEKTEAEIGLLKNMNLDCEIIPYSVPFLDEERHILVIRGK